MTAFITIELIKTVCMWVGGSFILISLIYAMIEVYGAIISLGLNLLGRHFKTTWMIVDFARHRKRFKDFLETEHKLK